MKKILLGLVIIALIVPAVGMAKKKDKDVTGTYSVKGYNPGVQTSGPPSYTGTLKITQSGGAYLLDWNVSEKKKDNYKGVGIYTDGVLSVGYKDGVVSYKVEKNTLKGVWAPQTGGLFGFEYCEKN